MNRSPREIMRESRTGLHRATDQMDEGKYRESAETCVRSAESSLRAVLASWDLEGEGSGCWGMLKNFGVKRSIEISPWLRQCCKRIDRYRSFYAGSDADQLDRTIDEEYAMELINYGREIIRFSQRNINRDMSDDPS